MKNVVRKLRQREPLAVTVKITGGRILTGLVIVGLAAACGAEALAPQALEFYTQDKISQHYNQVQPPFTAKGKSQLRQNLTEIEQAQVEGVQTTSFECPGLGCTKANPPQKVCPSIGAPIPVTDQLTNPDQPLRQESQPLNSSGGNVVVGQMDPNGVYSGNGAGTYILCIGQGGAIEPAYWEGNVEVEFGPAVWDQTTGTIKDIGPPSFQFTRLH